MRTAAMGITECTQRAPRRPAFAIRLRFQTVLGTNTACLECGHPVSVVRSIREAWAILHHFGTFYSTVQSSRLHVLAFCLLFRNLLRVLLRGSVDLLIFVVPIRPLSPYLPGTLTKRLPLSFRASWSSIYCHTAHIPMLTLSSPDTCCLRMLRWNSSRTSLHERALYPKALIGQEKQDIPTLSEARKHPCYLKHAGLALYVQTASWRS
ncbi:hypothetical protein C8Q78DRAFT_368429 [Trametes maxima]|nr:hypothetical protein C8Q78DRAFT_368429 [Trametes maxima]